jgi:hypothetical protein
MNDPNAVISEPSDSVLGWCKDLWAGHGTKIWGLFGVGFGAAGEALVYIQQLDQKHAALWGIVIVMGVGVFKRGFTNSRSLRDDA